MIEIEFYETEDGKCPLVTDETRFRYHKSFIFLFRGK